MNATKHIIRVLLVISVVYLAYLCVSSVVVPIRFENTRVEREQAVVANLIHLRTAEAEYKLERGRYIADLDSLILFLKTAPKKEVLKEGSLTDKQLENGMTEHKAAKMMEKALLKARVKLKTDVDSVLYAYVWENDRDIVSNGLQGFRRDTIYKNMIETLYKGQFTADNIADITVIPYSNGQRFEIEVNNDYKTSQGIVVPIMAAKAHYKTYLSDLNKLELVNLIDKEEKLDHYPGLMFGSTDAPNNNAGNWE
ncbi:MAG: hypothetical protein K5660_00765 [Paludibacteraceae bacterium]|nr:hypothetical protein [Paludibacteraceae bacterium]